MIFAPKHPRRWVPAMALALPALWPVQSLACATCFGRSDSPLAQGMNMGIASLLIVIVAVLIGVAGFFVHLARRAAAFEARNRSTLAPSRPSAP